MGPLATLLIATGAAGAAIPLGALIGHAENLREGEMRRDLLTAAYGFSGGALLAAVGLVLLPEGMKFASPAWIALLFLAGALLFLVLDRAVEKRGGHAALFMALLLDDVPGSIALGAAFAVGGSVGPLLALLVGIQNVPASFNAYREFCRAGMDGRRALGIISPIALLAPLGGLVGYFLLGGHATILAALFLVSAGGISYIFFQDIAPLAHREGHWVPTLGAVSGLLTGALGMAWLGGV